MIQIMRGAPPAYEDNALSAEIAETLRAARRSRGLSQEDLGERLGVTAVAVQAWEVGRAKPHSLRQMQRWARAVGRRLVIELR